MLYLTFFNPYCHQEPEGKRGREAAVIRRTWSRWWRRLTWSNASGRMTDQGGDLSPHSTTPDDLCCLSLQSGALPFAFIMYRLSALTFIARIGSATTRSTFVGAMSGHEGADVPDTDRSVALDAARLLAELRRTLGMPAAGDQEEDGDDEDDDSSEGSSFFSGSGGEDEEDEEEDGDEAMDGPGSSFARELERQMGGGVDGPMFHSQRPAGSSATPDTAAFH